MSILIILLLGFALSVVFYRLLKTEQALIDTAAELEVFKRTNGELHFDNQMLRNIRKDGLK
jgi:hypothetical protein